MKVFGLMMVRNEADILEVNVLHHLALGLDRILIVDNGSSDETPRILRRVAADRRIRFRRDEGSYRQSEIITELAHEAYLDGADWVLPIDADEFWITADGSPLDEVLAATEAAALQVELTTFVQRREQENAETSALLHMTRRPPAAIGPIERIRELVASRQIGYVESVYPPKWVSRASLALDIGMGNHEVKGLAGPWRASERIQCLHAPLRARSVLLAKMVDHGQRALELGEDDHLWWQAHRWRRVHENGSVDEEWSANSYRDDELNVYGQRHRLVFDPRLRAQLAPWIELVKKGTKCRRQDWTAGPLDGEAEPDPEVRLERYRQGVEALRAGVAKRAEIVAERERDIAFLKQELCQREQALEERRADIEFLRRERTGLQDARAAVEGELSKREGDVERLELWLADRDRAVVFLRGELAERDRVLTELRAQEAEQLRSLEGQQEKLDSWRKERQQLEEELLQRRSSEHEKAGALAANHQLVEQLRTQLAERDRMLEELRTQEAERRQALKSQREEFESSLRERQQLEAEMLLRRSVEQQKVVEHLRTQLSERDQWLSELKTVLSDLRREVEDREDLRAAVSSLEGELETERAKSADEKLHDRERIDILEAKSNHLEAHAAQQAEGIAWLRAEVAWRDRRITEVTGSLAWRFAERTKSKLSPIVRFARGFYRRAGALQDGVRRRFFTPAPAASDPTPVPPPTVAAAASSPVTESGATVLSFRAPMPGPIGFPRPASTRAARHDVLCFSIIDWSFRRQRPQQMMSRFAEDGHRVFFLSTSQFLQPGERRYRASPLRHNVWEITLAAPSSPDVYAGTLAPDQEDVLLAGIEQLRRDFNISWCLSIVEVSTWASLAFRVRDSFGWKIAYDCMDEWQTFPGMDPQVASSEEQLVSGADLLIVSAQRLWNKWSSFNPNTVLARNGSDFAHFFRPPAKLLPDDCEGPIIGYFGAISEWFDLELLVELVRQRPSYTFVLLGGVFDVDTRELAALPNVRLLGQTPYERLPAYLHRFDVCLIPFRVNEVTAATDPVKFYEYLSAGKPVVATPMPELEPYRDHYYPAAGPEEFVRQVDAALAEKDPKRAADRVELASQNTWQLRVAAIHCGIDRAHPRVSIVIVTLDNLDYNRLCLESLCNGMTYPNSEIIVVDNGSTDGSLDYLRSLESQGRIKAIFNSHNRGFGRATNQGVAAATGERLLLLNNDTVMPNGGVARLLQHLEDLELGLVVAVTNMAGNEARIDVGYRNSEEMEIFAQSRYFEHQGEVFDIPSAALYCVALRREVWETVGPLDEQFAVGMFEDDDYSERVREAGWRVVCAEDAFVHHFGQASFKKLPDAEYQAIWDRNQQLFEQKWGRSWVRHQARR